MLITSHTKSVLFIASLNHCILIFNGSNYEASQPALLEDIRILLKFMAHLRPSLIDMTWGSLQLAEYHVPLKYLSIGGRIRSSSLSSPNYPIIPC